MNNLANLLSSDFILGVLSSIGAGLGVLAVVYSLNNTFRRQRAEEQFRRKLARDKVYEQWFSQRNLLAHGQDIGLSKQELEILMLLLNKELRALDEDDRERIEEALYQPSLRGRINYISKLLAESKEESQNLRESRT